MPPFCETHQIYFSGHPVACRKCETEREALRRNAGTRLTDAERIERAQKSLTEILGMPVFIDVNGEVWTWAEGLGNVPLKEVF